MNFNSTPSKDLKDQKAILLKTKQDLFAESPRESILTRRETEVLHSLAKGFSTKMIADEFNLSINTVMNHRKNMLKKTNSKNSAELIHFGMRNNLL